MLYDLNLNLQLDKNVNFPPIAHFTFPNVVPKNQKSKKEKWQCQNIELNATCVDVHGINKASVVHFSGCERTHLGSIAVFLKERLT